MQRDARVEPLGADQLEALPHPAVERPLAGAPHGRVRPEPQLVDDAALDERAGELAAADHRQVALTLLQLRNARDGVAVDQRGVPLQRPRQRP